LSAWYFIAEKALSNNDKYSAFASFALLRLFFPSNSAVFVSGGAKIFLLGEP